jgi:hypothetical protein
VFPFGSDFGECAGRFRGRQLFADGDFQCLLCQFRIESTLHRAIIIIFRFQQGGITSELMQLSVYCLRAVSANHGHHGAAQIRGEAVRIFTHLFEALKSLVNDETITKNAKGFD